MENKTVETVVKDLLLADNQKKKNPFITLITLASLTPSSLLCKAFSSTLSHLL